MPSNLILALIVRMRELRLVGIVLGIVVLLLILTYFTREGFTAADSQHSAFAQTYRQKYNEVGAALTVSGLGPPRFNNIGALGGNTRGMFGSVSDKTDNNGNTTQYVDNPYPLEARETGIMTKVKKCEAIQTADCSAFDDTSFNTDCGICLDIGKNSQGKPATGGLLLLSDDKSIAQENRVGNFLAPYKPTVGSCPAKRMVGTKAECLKVQAEIQCQKNTTFDSPIGCSQCYSDTSYSIVDASENSQLIAGSGTLSIIGSGVLEYSESGQNNSGRQNLTNTPFQIVLQGPEFNNINLKYTLPKVAKPYNSGIIYTPDDLIIFNNRIFKMTEGAGKPGYKPDRQDDRLWQNIMAAADYRPPPPGFMAGYLSGVTASGEFQIDLYRLILTDSNTGRKPRTAGEVAIGGINVTKLNPGYGFKTIIAVARSPFTFVDPLSQEASMCPSSPFVTKQASSEFLGSDPCYARNSGPGRYAVACLQNTFLANGCTPNGKAYPTTTANSAALLYDSGGQAQTLDAISSAVYANAVLTATGVDINGTKVSIQEWSKASVFCTGITIESPCDTATQATGPLTPECITYLWNNQGENKRVGTSYTVSSLANSLFSAGNTPRRFCTTAGTMSPVNASGEIQDSTTSYWQGLGGLPAVTAAMKLLHQDANSSLLSDSAKMLAMQQCYGINLNPRPSYSTSFASDTSVNPNTNIQVGPNRSMTPTLVPGALGQTVNVRVGDSIQGNPLTGAALAATGGYPTNYNEWHALKYGVRSLDFRSWTISMTVNFNSVPSWNGEPLGFLTPSNNETGTGGGGQPPGIFNQRTDFATMGFYVASGGKLKLLLNAYPSTPNGTQNISILSTDVIPTGKDLHIDASYRESDYVLTLKLSGALEETITRQYIVLWTSKDYTSTYERFTGPINSQIWAAGMGNRFHADCTMKYLYIGPYNNADPNGFGASSAASSNAASSGSSPSSNSARSGAGWSI
jgi:hypothetical protein